MKKSIVFLFFGLIFLSAGNVQAALVSPYLQGLLDPVSFYAVDDPNSPDGGIVVLEVINMNLPAGYQLEYLYSGGSDWTLFQPATTFSIAPEVSELVFMRLRNTTTGALDTSATLTFSGLESGNLFNSLITEWDEGAAMPLSIITAGNDDNLAPVPLPAAFWLLGSGLLGLCGLRRKN